MRVPHIWITSGLFVVMEMFRSMLLSKMLSSFGVGGTYRQMNIASYRLDKPRVKLSEQLQLGSFFHQKLENLAPCF